MDHLNISEVIGDGIHPDELRVVAHWAAGKTETAIHIQCGPFAGRLKPNTDTVMPACVAQMLVESDYDVAIKYDAIVNPEADAELEKIVSEFEQSLTPEEQAERDTLIAAAQEKAAEVIRQPVDKLKAALGELDLLTLRFVLIAEEEEGPGKTRKGAIEAIEAAIDAHPDQKVALAAAAALPNENAEQTS